MDDDKPPKLEAPANDSSPNEVQTPNEQQGNEEGYELKGFKLFIVVFGLALAIFLMSLDSSIIATAVPRITSQFNSIQDIGWYGGAYTFAMCSVQPMSGKLFAHFSMKVMFLGFLAVFELGSLLCALAVDSPMLIVGRAIAGVGAAGIATGGFSIVAVSLPLRKRGAAIGILHSTFGAATIIGPVVGGALTEYASWRWCFWINLPIGAVTILFVLLFFHPPPKTGESASVIERLAKLDGIGLLLFIPSIIMLLLPLQWGGTTYAWSSATIIGLFVGGGCLSAVFTAWQAYKQDDAMIPPRLITQRTLCAAGFTNFFAMGAVLISVYYLPEWFQVIQAASPTSSGVRYLPLALSDIVSSNLAGMTVALVGYANPYILGGTALMSVGTGLFTTFTPATNHQRWIPYQVLQGLGAGMTLSMPYMATQTVLKPADIPVGTSIVQFLQFFGGSVFLAIAQAIFANKLVGGLSRLADIGIGPAEAQTIIQSGAASVRDVVTQAQLPSVVEAYNQSIVATFYVATAAAAAGFVVALGLEWRKIKKS